MAERVSFSRALYLPEAVTAAAEAYEALGTFEVEVGDDEVAVVITDPDPDVAPVLVDEFCNHVLHETIVRLRE
ncbi:MAG: hypothetical protein JRI23_15510 [Deltaproteobacteria bacterium]|jgi:hypothetical protein|nr:hypothetical protein [Deltaproteobacteria bacterium]MBW2533160.1 hypothetical protein [Deltaproteobacteria bacterium]